MRPGRPAFPAVYAAAALSVCYLLYAFGPRDPFGPPAGPPNGLLHELGAAAAVMEGAMEALKDCRPPGLPIDPAADPNATGLIGAERSEITTSAGRLEAKRTTTNPAFAELVGILLDEAGVRRGDVVAVGASSSFPALIVATLAAAEAMGFRPLVISSLGASEWGGNIPGFNWIDMEDCLRSHGVIDVRPIARAVGGDEDIGRDMSPEGRALLAARIRAGGVPFLEESDLQRNVARRMALYRAAAGSRPIKAFVNIGGSWANLGTDAGILEVEPGLARRVDVPPPSRRGVIQAMAAEGIPVIHLLNVKGLCERYGLPWDPRPLPKLDPLRVYDRVHDRMASDAGSGLRPIDLPVTALYVLAVALALSLGSRRRPI